MTDLLFRQNAYLKEAVTKVHSYPKAGGIILEQSLFYPTGGGQPGDSGWLRWEGQQIKIETTQKHGDALVLLPSDLNAALPPIGTDVTMSLDWERRFAHMRVHTALHLLSVVLPYPVTGGNITAVKGRLDFDMSDMPADKAEIEAALIKLISEDLRVTEEWISDDELAQKPDLIKTMSVKPPSGQGRVRLIKISNSAGEVIDLQPCGGTHVATSGAIGAVHIGKIEKKGRQNRRINVVLE